MLRSKQILLLSSLPVIFFILLTRVVAYDSPPTKSASIRPDSPARRSNDDKVNISRPHLIWKFKSKGSFSSAPAVSGEMVIVGDEEGTLSCLSADDGRKIWSRSFSGYFAASPVIDEKRVYITQSKREVTYYQESGGGIFQSAPRLTRLVEEDGAVRCLDP